MDFQDMGQLDANSEIEKGAIHSADVKGATVRLSNDFLELLNVVAGEVGLSRQAFMSKVIETYAPQAVADYLAGYSSSIHAKANAHQFFERAAVEGEMKNHLDNFASRVDNLMIDDRAYVEKVLRLYLRTILLNWLICTKNAVSFKSVSLTLLSLPNYQNLRSKNNATDDR